MEKETIYISVDVETTGASPCTSSCNMIGCVVFKDINITPETPQPEWIIDKKHWCIREIPGRPMTKVCNDSFWIKNRDLLEYINTNAIDARDAMIDFSNWYKFYSDKYNCVFIARPSSFDWQWINCLYEEFGPANKPVLPYSIICLSSIFKTAIMLGIDWNNTIAPLFEHPTIKLTHYADDDALYQAYMYLRITHWLKKNLKIKH